MVPAVHRPAEGDLHDPALRGTLCGIKQSCLLVNVEKHILNHVFCLAAVPHRAKRNAKHQPRIALEKSLKRIAIIGLQPAHEFLVALLAFRMRLRRIFFPSSPHQGESKKPSIMGSAHPGTHSRPVNGPQPGEPYLAARQESAHDHTPES